MHVCERGGVGLRAPITGPLCRRQLLSIGQEEREALQAANEAQGSKCSELLIRGSNELTLYGGEGPAQPSSPLMMTKMKKRCFKN